MVEAYGPSPSELSSPTMLLDQLPDEHLLETERGLVVLDRLRAGGADVGRAAKRSEIGGEAHRLTPLAISIIWSAAWIALEVIW